MQKEEIEDSQLELTLSITLSLVFYFVNASVMHLFQYDVIHNILLLFFLLLNYIKLICRITPYL